LAIARDAADLASYLRAVLREEATPSRPVFDVNSGPLFGGLVGVWIETGDTHILGPGISIAPTYAHCFSHFMAAFKRPPAPGALHPAPWVGMQGGGTAYDVEAEVGLEPTVQLGNLSRLDAVTLTASPISLTDGSNS